MNQKTNSETEKSQEVEKKAEKIKMTEEKGSCCGGGCHSQKGEEGESLLEQIAGFFGKKKK